MSAITPDPAVPEAIASAEAARVVMLRSQDEGRNRWNEESFRLMVESVTDYAIVMLDPAGIVVSWNSGAERIRGYSAEEIVGQHFSRFYCHQDFERGVPQRDLEAAAASGRLETEGWRARKDGSTFWAHVVFTAILDKAGHLRGFAKLTRDLTERRKVEAELTGAKAAAERANVAKSEFLSSMSHELRTPLNAILGFAQLLESDSPPPTPSQAEGIREITQAGEHLLVLIDGILDLALIESGRMSQSPQAVSLADLVDECRETIAPVALKYGIRVSFPKLDLPCSITGDRARLKQVLVNLLSNAIKYNRPGGSVTVDCNANAPHRVRISVTDTGGGLSPDQLRQLFQPFKRLGQELGTVEGTGIGLVVAKRLAELMGGTVGAESTVGKGSVFWAEFAVQAASERATGDLLPPLAAQAAPADDAGESTLLYVEDNPANLKLVEKIVARRPGIRLLSARTGSSGIELARASRPDVILMDINLPGMSGIKAMQILHADSATAHIPVVALSVNAKPIDIERGLQAGFFRYLTKPLKVNEFMETLDAALESANKSVSQCP